jgi:hypothetical protein
VTQDVPHITRPTCLRKYSRGLQLIEVNEAEKMVHTSYLPCGLFQVSEAQPARRIRWESGFEASPDEWPSSKKGAGPIRGSHFKLYLKSCRSCMLHRIDRLLGRKGLCQARIDQPAVSLLRELYKRGERTEARISLAIQTDSVRTCRLLEMTM